ncbi:MAG: endonuclease/exonuclease/phosphatase family protein [Bacteroidia bacterium]|nr:endonuclease/exonuclease/phosphatase family protein [Bacteroidia bacterium]
MKTSVFIFLTFFSVTHFFSQNSGFVSAIGFWNVENLYDTLDDPLKNDNEFTPLGSNRWDSAKYHLKIDRLSEVISNMAIEEVKEGLAILGLCEVENKSVLRDLVESSRLKARAYEFLIIEGPDSRGIDPALIYSPVFFKVSGSAAFKVPMVVDTSHQTRNILLVRGQLQNEELVILVNHWPSRRGGEINSRPNRISAAMKAKQICDSIRKAAPKTKIIVMGDFNDDPIDKSVEKITKSGLFFNPMEGPFKKGIGTLAWRDRWNLFDQILLSGSFLSGDQKSWQFSDVRIYNKNFLRVATGNFKGYPYRTYSGGVYSGGYSDHFPVYILLKKKID